MSAFPCQSVVTPARGDSPCEISASGVLFGVHLCGSHERTWRRRLQSGQKIQVHPLRALPLEHQCGADVEGTRRCSKCGQDKVLSLFRKAGIPCRACEAAYARDWYARAHPKPAAATPDPGPVVAPSHDDRAEERTEERPSPPAASSAPSPTGLARTSIAALEAWDRQLGPARPRPSLPPALLETAPQAQAQLQQDPADTGYAYRIELTCLGCGRWVCDVQVPSRTTPVVLHPSVRCRVCGGKPQPSGEVSRVYVGPTGQVLWAAGREGRAQAASLDHQAAS